MRTYIVTIDPNDFHDGGKSARTNFTSYLSRAVEVKSEDDPTPIRVVKKGRKKA